MQMLQGRNLGGRVVMQHLRWKLISWRDRRGYQDYGALIGLVGPL